MFSRVPRMPMDCSIFERGPYGASFLQVNAYKHTWRDVIFLYAPGVPDKEFVAYGFCRPPSFRGCDYRTKVTFFLMPRKRKASYMLPLLCYENVPIDIIRSHFNVRSTVAGIGGGILSTLHSKVLLPSYRLAKIDMRKGYEVEGKHFTFFPLFQQPVAFLAHKHGRLTGYAGSLYRLHKNRLTTYRRGLVNGPVDCPNDKSVMSVLLAAAVREADSIEDSLCVKGASAVSLDGPEVFKNKQEPLFVSEGAVKPPSAHMIICLRKAGYEIHEIRNRR